MKRILLFLPVCAGIFCALFLAACTLGGSWENAAADDMETRYISPAEKLRVFPALAGASGYTSGTNAPAQAVDGNLGTFWLTTQLAHHSHVDIAVRESGSDPAGQNGVRHWLTVDLGEVHPRVSKLEYHPRTSNGANGNISSCEIYASEEVNMRINLERAIEKGLVKKAGESSGWTTNTGWQPAITFTGDGTATGTVQPVSARFIQIRSLAAAGNTILMAVGEIRLYEQDEHGVESVIDLSGSKAFACCMNRNQVGMTADKAIDGDTTTNWLTAEGQSSHGNAATLKEALPADPHFDAGHWITLDLGAVYSDISNLQIHRRQDGATLGNINALEIWASETMIDPNREENPGMYLAATARGLPYTSPGSGESWSVVSLPVTARYLHIVINNDEWTGSGGNNFDGLGLASAAEFRIMRDDGRYTIDKGYLFEAWVEGKKCLSLINEAERPNVRFLLFNNALDAAYAILVTEEPEFANFNDFSTRQNEVDAASTGVWDFIYYYFPLRKPPEFEL
jgi:hypothetical protein